MSEVENSVKFESDTETDVFEECDHLEYQCMINTNRILSEDTLQYIEELEANLRTADIQSLTESDVESYAGISWCEFTNTRIVVGIGAVNRFGNYHTIQRNSIVLKFDIYENTNQDEIAIWNEAVQEDLTDLFAPIIAYDTNWVMMVECTPVSQYISDSMKTRDVLYDQAGDRATKDAYEQLTAHFDVDSRQTNTVGVLEEQAKFIGYNGISIA